MDALRKDTPAHLTQQHTFTFPFELLPDGQERPRFLPPRPSDRQSRSTTKHSQPFEVEGESSPRNGERNRERENYESSDASPERNEVEVFSILAARDTSSKVGKRSLDGLTREVASGNGF